jgi:hypothetical protein
MIQRGRRSAASLATVSKITDARPAVPDDMPEAQAAIWRATVNRLPFDWFKAEHLPMLQAYCQHVAIGQEMARQIEAFEPGWLRQDGGLERFDKLSRVLDREHRCAIALARTMRITHGSQYDKSVAAKLARPRPEQLPWERHK